MGSSSEIWGHLYPREGAVNQQMDPKAATVVAVRALDVLKTDVSSGSHTRVGVSLPGSARSAGGRWQMIYPVQRECRTSPFYEDDSIAHDFMAEEDHALETRGYAWNYYHVYQCCMNERGRLVEMINLPRPICIDVPGSLVP